MPRKTRREKLAATVHKQAEKTVEPQDQVQPAVKVKKSPFASDDMTKEYFLKDLRKSLIIVSVIIFVEFALYFANLSGILTSVNF